MGGSKVAWVTPTGCATPPGPCACRNSTLEVNCTVTGETPDGAAYGLYLHDIDRLATVSNAWLTYWIIGYQQATWRTLSGHSTCWSGPTRGDAERKSDGLVYTPYAWTYTCPILSSEVSTDGRLRLGGFHVQAAFIQDTATCSDVTYWTQRSILVDQDGTGPRAGQKLTFERRNGTRGPANLGAAQSTPADPEGGQLT